MFWIRAAAESAEGKRASTEDDESVEFSFPIMHVEEGFDDGYLHTDSYGHQSRVTPERSKFLPTMLYFLSLLTKGLCYDTCL